MKITQLFVFVLFGILSFRGIGYTQSGMVEGEEIGTGSEIGTGIEETTTSDEITTGDTIDPPPPVAQIVEIYPKDTEKRGEYIMILFSAAYQGSVRIVGAGTSTAEKIFSVTVSAGQSVIFTDSPTKLQSLGQHIITTSSITLTDTGEPLDIILDDGTIRDSIIYTNSQNDQANNWNGSKDASGKRIFSVLQTPTALSAFGSSSGSGTQGGSGENTTGTIITTGATLTGETTGTGTSGGSGNTGGTPPASVCTIQISPPIISGDTYLLTATLSGLTTPCGNTEWSINNIQTSVGCILTHTLSGGMYQIATQTSGCVTTSLYLPEIGTLCEETTTGSGSILSGTQRGSLHIDEIYPRDSEDFPEYIELYFSKAWKGPLTIHGLGQGDTEKIVNIAVGDHSRVIITDDSSFFSPTIHTYLLPSISLTDGGEELRIEDEYGHEIDRVVYSGLHRDRSGVSSSTYISGLVRQISGDEPPTPGFTTEMVSHLLPQEDVVIPICGIDTQHSSPLYVTNKINLQALVDYIPISNSDTTYTCEWIFSGAETMTYMGCNPTYIGYPLAGVYPVQVRISRDQLPMCDISYEINIPEKITSTTKSGGSKSSSSSNGSSYYEELYRKRKERFELLKEQTELFGLDVGFSGFILGSGEEETSTLLLEAGPVTNIAYQVRIHGVIANPEGKDTLGEQIILENITDVPLFTDQMKIRRNGSTKKLPPGIVLSPHEQVVIVGDLGLVNKPACIELILDDDLTILSSFCYIAPQEGVRYTGGVEEIKTPQEKQLFGDLDIILEDSQSCVIYKDQSVVCKKLPFTITEAKERKSGVKKLPSLTKKISTLEEKYALRRDKYAKQSQTHKKSLGSYIARNGTLRQEISDQKKKSNRYRSFYYLLKNELIQERKPLLSSSSLQNIDHLYEMLDTENQSLTLGPVEMSTEEVEARYELFVHGELPLDHIEVGPIIDHMRQKIDAYSQLVHFAMFADGE